MLNSTMPKKDTEQLHLRPPRELINRLSELAVQFKKESANQVAVEVLREYLEFWARAEQAKYDTILQQKRAVTGALKAAMLRLPLHGADAEALNQRPEAQGKKGRK
jgi:hypothetical protein